jgi:AmmeMemoRadiSam system protein B
MKDDLNIRRPSVAGQFYPDDPRQLRELISGFQIAAPAEKQQALGCVLPHAGYIYSGRVAAKTLAQVNIRDTLVLLGPNHSGIGPDFSLMPEGYWRTPFGDVEIDSGLSGLFLGSSKYLHADYSAHLEEHSLEVELPLLQYFRKDFKIVPITIKADGLDSLKALADDLAGVITRHGLLNSIMFIASSDMTHYEPQQVAKKKDALAIEAMLLLNEDKLERTVRRSAISMCGFAPVAVLLRSARLLGAKKGKLIKYQTSGEESGDMSSVVGYAGITIT